MIETYFSKLKNDNLSTRKELIECFRRIKMNPFKIYQHQ